MQGNQNSENGSPSNLRKLVNGVGGAIKQSLVSAVNLVPVTHFIGEGYRFYQSDKSKGSWLLTTANALFFNTPLFANDQGENLSIEKREERLQGKDIYIVPSDESLPTDDLFALAAKKTIQNSTDYQTKFLKALDQDIQTEIKKVFALDNANDSNHKTQFENLKKQIKARIDSKKPQDSLDFRYSIAQLEELGHVYLKAKHDREKIEISKIFSAQGSRGLALKNAPNVELTADELEKLSVEQADRLKALETGQAEELKVYQNEMTKCIESTHKAQSMAVEHVNIISRLMKNSHNRKTMLEIVRANKQANVSEGRGAMEALDANNLSGEDTAGIDLDKVLDAGIRTESGLKIQRLAQGVYEINFPNHLFAPGYYFSANNNLETDLKEMFEIASLKYNGRITFTLTGMSPDNAQKAGRAAFNSWASLGKNPADLVVKLPCRDKDGNVIMETKRYKDFFPDAPERHAKARKDYSTHMAKHAPKDANDIKKRMEAIKAEKQVGAPVNDAANELNRGPAGVANQ